MDWRHISHLVGIERKIVSKCDIRINVADLMILWGGIVFQLLLLNLLFFHHSLDFLRRHCRLEIADGTLVVIIVQLFDFCLTYLHFNSLIVVSQCLSEFLYFYRNVFENFLLYFLTIGDQLQQFVVNTSTFQQQFSRFLQKQTLWFVSSHKAVSTNPMHPYSVSFNKYLEEDPQSSLKYYLTSENKVIQMNPVPVAVPWQYLVQAQSQFPNPLFNFNPYCYFNQYPTLLMNNQVAQINSAKLHSNTGEQKLASDENQQKIEQNTTLNDQSQTKESFARRRMSKIKLTQQLEDSQRQVHQKSISLSQHVQKQANTSHQDNQDQQSVYHRVSLPLASQFQSKQITLKDAKKKLDIPNSPQLSKKNKAVKQLNLVQIMVKSMIQLGFGMAQLKQYLNRYCHKNIEDVIKGKTNNYYPRINAELIKVVNTICSVLKKQKQFKSKVEHFNHEQMNHLIKYIKFYKSYFEPQAQKTIEDILMHNVGLIKAVLSRQKAYQLYVIFTEILHNKATPFYDGSNKIQIPSLEPAKQTYNQQQVNRTPQAHPLQVKIEEIDDRTKMKLPLVAIYRKFDKASQWKREYKCLKPEYQKCYLITQFKHILKQIFLQSFYKFQSSISRFKIGHLSKYLAYIKHCILYEKILMPSFRKLGMILMDIFQDKQIDYNKTVAYVQKFKNDIRSTRGSNSLSPMERFEYERKNREVKQQYNEADIYQDQE